MEGTIWEKMIDSIDEHIHIEFVNADKSIIQGQNECAKAFGRVCLQAQIDLLNPKGEELIDLSKSYDSKNIDFNYGIKQGILMAASSIQKEIQELEKQLL